MSQQAQLLASAVVEEAEGEKASQISGWLRAWAGGDPQARDRVIEVLYDELKGCAARLLRHERADHTLHTTALVNEAYCRLAVQSRWDWHDRRHFMALAATAMRHVLVDHARARLADKRGGGDWHRVQLDALGLSAPAVLEAPEVLAVHEALAGLARIDPVYARVVELRCFGGFSIEEVAEVLESSPATVKRQWAFARAFLYRALDRSAAIEPSKS